MTTLDKGIIDLLRQLELIQMMKEETTVTVCSGTVEVATLEIFAVLPTRSPHFVDIRNAAIESLPVCFLTRIRGRLFWVSEQEISIGSDST